MKTGRLLLMLTVLYWMMLISSSLLLAASGTFHDELAKYDKDIPTSWGNLLQNESKPKVWSGDELKYIGMPVGGICTGTLYIGGDGTLWNWDVFNVRTLNPGGPGDKFYLKPMQPENRFDQGFVIKTTSDDQTAIRPLNKEGFKNVEFVGQYPVATVKYVDKDFPVQISLKAFSPFIPTDADASGLPATVMQYTLTNTGNKAVEVELAGYLQNAVCLFNAQKVQGNRVNSAVTEADMSQLLCTAEKPKADNFSSRSDILFEDFEQDDWAGWTVKGKAFGSSPFPQHLRAPQQQNLANYQGKRLVNTHDTRQTNGNGPAADQLTGKLISQSFTIERRYITASVAGGKHPGTVEMRVIVDGKTVGTVTGNNSNKLQAGAIDVSRFEGKHAHIELVDENAQPNQWGILMVDQIVFSDRLPAAESMEGLADYGSMALSLLDRQDNDWISVSSEVDSEKTVDWVFGAEQSGRNEKVGINEKIIGSVGRKLSLNPGDKKTVTFVISWFFPNLHTGSNGLSGLRNMDKLRTYYSKQFDSAGQVGQYIQKNSDKLIDSTLLWNKTWYDSTLPEWFLNRVFIPADSLATTVFQRFTDLTGDAYNDGRIYGWEGVYLGTGTCTHVLHYEQAMGRLFPNMTRQLREQVDYGLSYRDDGVIRYRGEHSGAGHHYGSEHAVDGHCGTILRTYREHTMSPDNSFLKRNYSKIKKSVEVLIAQDKQKTGTADGILEGAQYNTLDRVWYGKIPWTSTMYCAALRAGSEMAADMGDIEFSAACTKIANSGYQNIPVELFNGEYFIQKLDPEKLYAPNVNIGCHIDQMLGQYWVSQAGLPDILPPDKSGRALQSLFKYNFQSDVGPYLDKASIKPVRFYALPGEAGTVICSFPKGGADKAPGKVRNEWEKLVIGYFSECMTGFEYQAAAQMIDEGLVAEGFAIVKAIDERYHASKRNPYNEVEYGNHYSRAMSSYGCLVSVCGFEYHGPKGVIGFAPRLSPENFKAPFTVAQGWGTYSQTRSGRTQTNQINLKYGTLTLNELRFKLQERVRPSNVSVKLNGRRVPVKYNCNDSKLFIAMDKTIQLKAGSVLNIEIK